MKHTSGDTRKLLKGIPITKPFKEYLDICTKTAEIVSTDRDYYGSNQKELYLQMILCTHNTYIHYTQSKDIINDNKLKLNFCLNV